VARESSTLALHKRWAKISVELACNLFDDLPKWKLVTASLWWTLLMLHGKGGDAAVNGVSLLHQWPCAPPLGIASATKLLYLLASFAAFNGAC